MQLLPCLVATLPLLASAAPSIHVDARQTGGGLFDILFGPFTFPRNANISNANIRLINFGDEVFDISSISIFGDINDGGCEENENETIQEAAENGQQVVLGPASVPVDPSQIQNSQIELINFADEVFDISSITIFGDVNDGTCAPQTGTT
ncbi:hypothetical protein V5O48_009147 [Marasmius crinis-equi]|uniref:Uncharacterized protein n=1 Tax=Marasmius crinis-equi TaxID=585013 RepID=A0ABR3FC14_9AGAR